MTSRGARSGFAWRLVAFACVGALARPAQACAPAPRPGERVQIADEAAVIVWDARAHVEHFVRRASFRGSAKDFGFLVPTPSKPELGEVGDDVFDRLERTVMPEVVKETKRTLTPVLLCAFPLYFMRATSRSAAPEAMAPVRVLATQRVAGFDAVVLEADDASALAAWLADHGYAQRPELAAWLAPYVTARWKLTAFKVAADAASRSAATAAVRMSFATDKPFYPYREPSDQRENLPANEVHARRALRVFFIGTERVSGAIGKGSVWPGRATWSDRIDPAAPGTLPFALPEHPWLTAFEDDASPRPGTDDLFFSPGDPQPVRPPPVVYVEKDEVPLPVDVIVALGAGAWWLVKRARRKGS